MATSVVTTCDFVVPDSGRAHDVPATTRFEAFLNGKTYEADLCDECVTGLQRSLTKLGVRPSIALIDGKPRGAYVTATGRAFTTAEAREWLRGNGYDVNDAGRVSKDMLNAYAEAH